MYTQSLLTYQNLSYWCFPYDIFPINYRLSYPRKVMKNSLVGVKQTKLPIFSSCVSGQAMVFSFTVALHALGWKFPPHSRPPHPSFASLVPTFLMKFGRLISTYVYTDVSKRKLKNSNHQYDQKEKRTRKTRSKGFSKTVIVLFYYWMGSRIYNHTKGKGVTYLKYMYVQKLKYSQPYIKNNAYCSTWSN